MRIGLTTPDLPRLVILAKGVIFKKNGKAAIFKSSGKFLFKMEQLIQSVGGGYI